MTNELEKTFFDTLGIPQLCCKKYITNCTKYGECEECVNYDKDFSTYPQITDRILLELICIINQMDLYFYDELYCFTAFNYKDLKEEVISKRKRLADKNALSEVTGEHIKHQVRTLFEDNNDDR